MIRAIIIDDEPKNIKILQNLVKDYCPEISVAGTASNVDSAYELILKENPDLLFLDIELIYGNAFDLLDKLRPLKFEVIFVTAYRDYALKALKYSALDYLLKPVNIEDLKQSVQKATERRNLKDINEKLNNLMYNLQKPQEKLTRIAVPTAQALVFIPFHEIVRLQAMGAYTYVYTQNSKVIATKNMKHFEELLPENMFCRIHNSHIINLNVVKNYQKGRGGQVVLLDGTVLDVASRRRELLLEKMKI